MKAGSKYCPRCGGSGKVDRVKRNDQAVRLRSRLDRAGAAKNEKGGAEMKPRELVPPVFFRLLSPRLLDGLRERGRLYYVMFCFMRCVGCRSDIGGYFGVLYLAPPRSDLTVMPPEGCNAYQRCLFFSDGIAQAGLLLAEKRKG